MVLFNFANKENKKFSDLLTFKSQYKEQHKHVEHDHSHGHDHGHEPAKKEEETIEEDEGTQKVIANLYKKVVPAYLLEDHPAEIPLVAKNLIRKVGNQKGNGMPAEQLDLELSILFRNFNLFQQNMKKGEDDESRQADS